MSMILVYICTIKSNVCTVHRRRIKTEAKAKVVSSVRGTEFIQCLAAPAILYLYNFEE